MISDLKYMMDGAVCLFTTEMVKKKNSVKKQLLFVLSMKNYTQYGYT